MIYMDAQVYVGVLFQKELIRQLLCLPALEKTEDFSAQILDEILTRSDVHVANAQQIFDMLFCGKRISLESQIDLFVQCINHPAFQGSTVFKWIMPNLWMCKPRRYWSTYVKN